MTEDVYYKQTPGELKVAWLQLYLIASEKSLIFNPLPNVELSGMVQN